MASARLSLGWLLVPVLMAGCVDPFHGSQIEMRMSGGVSADVVPFSPALTPAATHYELWVTTHDIVAPVVKFKIQTPLDLNDPCLIEYNGDQAGLPILDAAKDREMKAMAVNDVNGVLGAQRDEDRISHLSIQLRAVVSYENGDPHPPASIAAVTDRAMRLQMCNAFRDAHPGYYIGNQVVLALPRNGVVYGFVDGQDPTSSAFIGGFTFITDFRLVDAVELFVTAENDDDPGTKGPVYMSGTGEDKNRGVRFFRMFSPIVPATQATASVYSDEDQDSVHF